MIRAQQIIISLAVVGGAIGTAVALLLTPKIPQELLGQSVAVEFTKGAWVGCLSLPNSRVVLLAFSADGITVREEQPNMSVVTKTPEGAAQCQSVGIARADGSGSIFFLPYSVVYALEQNGKAVWSNPLSNYHFIPHGNAVAAN